jgi:regulation of enolase protein 1 (concanavalin A-like superfamily)
VDACDAAAANDCQMFSVTAAGTDVWGTADQFEYVYRAWTGDGVVVARVASLEGTDVWAKAGLMIRETLAAGSRHAFVLASPGKGIAFQRRRDTNGLSTHTSGGTGTAPVWLRLERSGAVVSAFRSADGVKWQFIGADTFKLPATVYVGIAVTGNDEAMTATARVSDVSVGPLMPAEWKAADVNAPPVVGTTSYENGMFLLSGSGDDIWGTADQFRFAYRQVSGDVDIVARVAYLANTDPWAKAGLMIRESLSPSATHASVFVSPGKGVAFQRRPVAGGLSVHTSGGPGKAPTWLKLERRGDVVTALRSDDGMAWTLIGHEGLVLPSTFYVGMALTSQWATTRGYAVFDSVDVAVAAAPAANVAPEVELTVSRIATDVTVGESLNLTASASDSDGTVAGVEFFANGTLIGADTTAPYTATWVPTAAGTYSITAVARDDDGDRATSTPWTLAVIAPANKLPQVALTTSIASAFTVGQNVPVGATAADTDGSVVRVDFFASGVLIGSDATAPYATTWQPRAAGTYAITAIALDNAGGAATSAAWTVTAAAPAPAPAPAKFTAVFVPSADHGIVETYVLRVYKAGATSGSAVAVRDLGKPAVIGGEIAADVTSLITALAAGNYSAAVEAVGPGGASASAMYSFTR